MHFYIIIVYLMVLPWRVMSQVTYPHTNQYTSSAVSNISQQQNPSIQSSNVHISSSSPNYLVGNLSQPYTFQVAPSSIKVTHLGLNGYPLYIIGIGFSNKSKFNYDEQTNRLTILSLDLTTVGYYSAIDANWKTFTNILTAINVSSFQIRNFHISEDVNSSSFVSCSVSIIRSTFKLSESYFQTKILNTENFPRLNLFLSNEILPSSIIKNRKIYNDTLNEQNFTRIITLHRSLTRADHNQTIQCQIESNNNNNEIYLIKTVFINIEYGPNFETGALSKINLESEILKNIALECQIEANPNPSYVWYEMLSNISKEQNVFGTTKQIQKIYQDPGNYTMQCQAQSRGKTLKQEFFIYITLQRSNMIKSNLNHDIIGERSNKIPIIIGICIGSILFLLIIAIIIATIIYVKRRKNNLNEKNSINNNKLSNDKQGKSRWGNKAIDYSKFKHEPFKTDSTSTSHLVESAETTSIQAPPIPARPSPMTSTHSSYRQAPSTSISFSYRQASALPGFHSSIPTTYSYSSEKDNEIPLTISRSKMNTLFGSHKSLTESIQSLRSNQQPSISLPLKKRSNDYQNTIQLQIQQQQQQQQEEIKNDNTSEEEEEEEEFEQQQQIKDSTGIPSEYNQGQITTPSLSQKINTNQTSEIHHDEIPPSYHQVANTSTPSHAYIYHEPTEV